MLFNRDNERLARLLLAAHKVKMTRSHKHVGYNEPDFMGEELVALRVPVRYITTAMHQYALLKCLDALKDIQCEEDADWVISVIKKELEQFE